MEMLALCFEVLLTEVAEEFHFKTKPKPYTSDGKEHWSRFSEASARRPSWEVFQEHSKVFLSTWIGKSSEVDLKEDVIIVVFFLHNFDFKKEERISSSLSCEEEGRLNQSDLLLFQDLRDVHHVKCSTTRISVLTSSISQHASSTSSALTGARLKALPVTGASHLHKRVSYLCDA